MIPLVQLIVALAGVVFAPGVLRSLGLNPLPMNDTSTQGTVTVLSDHPAARVATSPAAPAPGTPAVPGTPAPAPTQPKSPGVKDLAGKALDNGWVAWAVVGGLFAFPLAMSQFRAFMGDVKDTGGSVYRESQNAYKRVDNADDYTGLEKHRRGRK